MKIQLKKGTLKLGKKLNDETASSISNDSLNAEETQNLSFDGEEVSDQEIANTRFEEGLGEPSSDLQPELVKMSNRTNEGKGNQNKKHQTKDLFSIKTKLTLSHIAIGILPMIVIAILMFAQGKNAILTEVEQANIALADKAANTIDLKIADVEQTSLFIAADQKILALIAKNPEDYENLYYFTMDRKDNLYSTLTSLRFSNKDLLSIVFIQEDEIIDPDRNPIYLGDTFVKDFYASEVFKTVEAANTKPIWAFDLYGTKDIFFMRAIRNIYSAKFLAVLSIQISPKYLLSELDASKLSAGARLSVVDEKGNVVVSSDETIDGQAIPFSAELLSSIDTKRALITDKKERLTGSFVTKQNVREESMIVYSECANGWKYVVEMPTSQIYSGISKIKVFATLMSFGFAIVAILVGIGLAISITKPIDYIRKRMKLVEEGDLTIQSDYVGRHEIGQLSKSFNQMTTNMRELIMETRTIAVEVSSDTDEFNKIANQSALASKEVMEAVESVSQGAMEQAQDADKAAQVIRELINKMNETEDNFNEVVTVTTRTKKATAEAKTTIVQLNASTKETVNLSDNIQKDMKELVARFKDILNIINLIDGISSQTNLLALNAAIEAARAGEAGRGFAVVADEVRKLAVQSKDAAKNISDIVNSIYQATTRTEEMIANGSSIYETQAVAVSNTEKTFEEISKDMDAIISEVDKVYILLSGLEEIQTEATDSITSIAAISEESASAIQEVLASGEEQTAAADHLAEMANKLGGVITELSQKIERFKVNE